MIKAYARINSMDTQRAGLTKLLFVAAVLVAMLLSLPSFAATLQQKVPAGSPAAEVIHFQYAVYYLPTPSKDPLALLDKALRAQKVSFKSVAEMPDAPVRPLVSAHLEKNVAQNYAPPDMQILQYFGHGLSRSQAETLQRSRQALIINFGLPRAHVWDGLRAATEAVERVARQSSGLVWDEETREIFTPNEWHKRRVATWTEQIPDVSRHTTIHAYQDGEYVRAITLGMAKFGLPDVVVQNFSWSQNKNIGNLINAFCQAMVEGASFDRAGIYDLDISAIHNSRMRKQQNGSLMPNARKLAHLSLKKGMWEEGDPRNRLIEIGFDRYEGKDVHAQQSAMLDSMYGWQDEIKRIKHNDELLAASRKARARLPALRAAFAAGLQPGEFIEVKAPFATPSGGNEWMWVEVTTWKGKQIQGLLKNEPFDIPDLHGGQIVKVNEDEVFDYIRRHPDGSEEGNETSRIIEQMQGEVENSQ